MVQPTPHQADHGNQVVFQIVITLAAEGLLVVGRLAVRQSARLGIHNACSSLAAGRFTLKQPTDALESCGEGQCVLDEVRVPKKA